MGSFLTGIAVGDAEGEDGCRDGAADGRAVRDRFTGRDDRGVRPPRPVNRAAFNWFETTQHGMAALMVLAFSRLGDIRGHKRVLIWTTTLTALRSWILVFELGPGR